MTTRLVWLPLLLALSACGNLFPDDQEMVQRARDYLGERRVNAAAIELRNALQKNPENAEARNLLGNISLSFGDYAAAAKEYRRAGAAGWDPEQTATGLAQALLGMGNYRELIDEIPVVDSYATATQADLHAMRALAEAGLGNMGQAGKSLDAATGLDADSLQVLKATIQIRLADGDVQAAEAALATALELYPDNKGLQLVKAGILFADGDTEATRKLYQGIIAADPPGFITSQGRQARMGLVRLQLMAGELEAAEATLKPLYRRNPKDPETNYLGGMLAFEQGNIEHAEELIFKVLKRAPQHSPTHLLYATLKFQQEDYEQAAYYLSKYLATNPDNINARKLLGRTYLLLGEHEEARTTLQQAATEKAGDAELLALLGMSELQGGATAAGIASLEKAVASAPDNTRLRSELARAYITTGETDQAIRELRLLVEDDAGNERSRILLVVAYLRAGQHDQAIKLALEMLKRHPDAPELLAMTGSVFAVSGDTGEARNYYTKALRVRPHYLQATMMLARLEEQTGNTERATRLYQGLVDAGEKSAGPQLALARLAGKQGSTDEMVAWLDRARKHDPQDVNSRIMLADYYLNSRQFDKAGPLIKDALKLTPRSPKVLSLQGRQLMAEKRCQEALLPIEQLVTGEPDSTYARVLLAECRMQLGQPDAARRQLDIALEQQPYYLPALVQMARLELQAGAYDAALDYSARAVKTDPGSYAGHELAGNAWMGKQDYAEAGKAYVQAWERRQSSGLVLKLAHAMAGAGDYMEAVRYLEQWLGNNDGDVQAREFLGTVYQNQGEDSKAVTTYETVLQYDPGNPVALNNLAWLYVIENNPRALELAGRAWRENPDNAGIKDTYGWVLVQSGQAGKGLKLLAEAIEVLPDVPEVSYHYAVALMKSGRQDEGRQRLRELLDSGVAFEGRDQTEVLLGGS